VSKNNIDTAMATLTSYIRLLNDERFILEIVKNSQMSRADLEQDKKRAEYMLVTYEVMLRRGFDSPFSIDY